ncbi:MAG: SH3 domain-containing protein [Bacteroidota bacterium]
MKLSQFFLLFSLAFMIACGGENTEQAPSAEAAADSPETEASAASAVPAPAAKQAICLWPQVGLRDKAGRKDAEYLTGISFGEKVELLGESVEVAEEKRTYIKVRLSDGKEGFVNSYLFAEDAERMVATSEIDVYKRPDLTTFKGDKIKRGQLVALTNNQEGNWTELMALERKPSGWVQSTDNLSSDEIDVTVAVLYGRAMQQSGAKRQKLLDDIAANSTFAASGLMDIVDGAREQAVARAALPDNQMYITATNLNVRSAPDTEADNVVFKLGDGDIVDIIERGEQVAIRDMNDYWYKISYQGQEGWVYGAFTSKKL